MGATKHSSKNLDPVGLSIRSYVLRAAATIFVTIAATGAAPAQTGQGAPGMENFGIDATVQNFLKMNNLPGATIAVTRGGRLVWAKGYGKADLANGTEMQPWHRTYIGSVSKFITGVGAMKLVEMGKLDLNAKVHGQATPVWPKSPFDAAGIVVNGDGALMQDAKDYFSAILQGVHSADPNFPPSKSKAPNLAMGVLYRASVDLALNAASAVRVKHLLSHTSGLLRGSDTDGAAAYFKKSKDDISFAEVHKYILLRGQPRPFHSVPETKDEYSNHAFALAGYLMGQADGTEYREFTAREILNPLGLQQVVAINTANGVLDATPYSENGKPRPLNPSDPSRLLTATGGWTASARDLVRVMCSLDRATNGHRVISQASVTTMETPPVPAFPSQPIGWDRISNGVLSKNGEIDGGTALIRKYLPGSRGTPDEINVAITINKTGVEPASLIEEFAGAAALAQIPDDYDLFDPQYRCFTPPPERADPPRVHLIGFYPARSNNLLPPKIADSCPATITLKGMFNNFPQGKLEYRFRFPVENRVSTTFSTVIKGDPKDPLYQQPEVYHDVPLPLPAPIKPPAQGGVPPGPGGFAVLEPTGDPIPPFGQKGPQGPKGLVAPAGPDNIVRGMVVLEALTATGTWRSNALNYHVECETKPAILSGTAQLRDDHPRAPACPRPASVAASIRTNKTGQVDYVLACTGDERTWKGTTVAHQTAPNTFIGVVTHPIQIAKQEDVICFLRRGEQFGFADVLATAKRLYPCKVTGVTTPDPVPPPPGPPGGFVSDPPRLVCVGGTIIGRAGQQSCDCPRGHQARQTGANRFQCVRDLPDLVCVGGRVAGSKSASSCVCPAGQTAKQVAANRFQCTVDLVCEGGRVVTRGQPPRASCECPRGFIVQKVPAVTPASIRAAPGRFGTKDDEPDRFRCVRITAPDKGIKGGGRAPVPVR